MTQEKAQSEVKEQDLDEKDNLESESPALDKEVQENMQLDEKTQSQAQDTPSKGKSKRKRRSYKEADKVDPELKKKAAEEVKEINDVKTLKDKRDEYNDKTKSLIQEHKTIDEDFKLNRERANEYKEKRDELNDQVKELKEKKNSLYDKINEINETLKDLKKKEQENKKSEKAAPGKRGPSLKKVKAKIRILEQKIITDNLEMKEENEIINQIQDLEQTKLTLEEKTGSSSDIRKKMKEISALRTEIAQLNDNIQELSEESQNFHVLMMEFYRDNDSKRKELDRIRTDLRETKVIADEYHNKYRDLTRQQKTRSRSKSYGNKGDRNDSKKLKRKIQEETLSEALKKKKDGKKLNIFEARALFESAVDKDK